MKKILLFVVLFSMSFLVTGCKDELTFEETLQALNDGENYTMISVSDIPNFGTMEVTMKMDGDYGYMTMLGSEAYIVKKDNLVYTVTKVNQDWVMSEIEDSLELDGMVDVGELDIEMFDKEGDTYTLKADLFDDLFGEEASSIQSFSLTFKKNGELVMEMEMTVESIQFETTINVTDIGDTEVSVPIEVMDLVNAQ